MKVLLLPFAVLFFVVSSLRNFLYDIGVFKQHKVPKPVVCIGNITTGGTGKTPWVQMLSSYFSNQGKRVAVLSRGYRGQFDGVLEVKDGMDAKLCGDEPLWLKRNSQARIFVGKSRRDAAKIALEKDDVDLFLLDDGFQHRALKRDVDIVLLDASAPNTHYMLLPMGYMRESCSALKRAQLVVISKVNYASPERVDWLLDRCHRYLDPSQVFLAEFAFKCWKPLLDEDQDELGRDNICLSCGVGNPQAFVDTVSEQGITPIKKFIFPDHFYWRPDDVEKMTYQMQQLSSYKLVVTEKDAVKLIRYKKHFKEMGIQVWVCKMQIQIKNKKEEFFTQLSRHLEGAH